MKDLHHGKGRVWIYGDHVDTDVIYPGRLLGIVDPQEMALHAMEGLDPGFARDVREGDIIVAGENFGCGSSRENAPLALKYAGIQLIIADYFARLFYRNALNIGLPVMICKGLSKRTRAKDILRVDMIAGAIVNETTREESQGAPLSDFEARAFQGGGLFRLEMEKIRALNT